MSQLISGNPWGENDLSMGNPASFTRFILPFSYFLQWASDINGPKAKDDLYFETTPIKKFNRERTRYFTGETAEVLYGRALWAQIPKKVWNNETRKGSFSFLAPESQQTLKVIISQPWVVLFEGKKENGAHELLQNGFLILETYLDPEAGNASLDDLLAFNELFRFFDQPYPKHASKITASLNDFPADYVSCTKIDPEKKKDQFATYKQRWLSLLQLPLLKKGQWYTMIPKTTIETEKNSPRACNLSSTRDTCLNYSDNRAFVWTCAIIENGAEKLATEYSFNVEEPFESGHWLRLLNVDEPGKTPEDSHSSINAYQKEWLKKRTYLRWTEGGTYYGYCYHSGAMLASPATSPPLWYHFGQMYFDQILLLFYLRITLFSFSQELTRINDTNNRGLLKKEFKSLRRSFAKFTNLYQFPLISNQQQGVEMYAIARKHMDIEGLFSDVKDEVTSTHEFLEMETSAKLEKLAIWIAVLGFIFALPEYPKILNYLKLFWSFLN